MIPRAYIDEWRAMAPWSQAAWVEQDLIISRVLLGCFNRYMKEGGHTVTRAQFEQNLYEKANDPAFRGDITPLLRPGVAWDFDAAIKVVLEQLVEKLPGDPWRYDGG